MAEQSLSDGNKKLILLATNSQQ